MYAEDLSVRFLGQPSRTDPLSTDLWLACCVADEGAVQMGMDMDLQPGKSSPAHAKASTPGPSSDRPQQSLAVQCGALLQSNTGRREDVVMMGHARAARSALHARQPLGILPVLLRLLDISSHKRDKAPEQAEAAAAWDVVGGAALGQPQLLTQRGADRPGHCVFLILSHYS